jgi:hypothetical protein
MSCLIGRLPSTSLIKDPSKAVSFEECQPREIVNGSGSAGARSADPRPARGSSVSLLNTALQGVAVLLSPSPAIASGSAVFDTLAGKRKLGT